MTIHLNKSTKSSGDTTARDTKILYPLPGQHIRQNKVLEHIASGGIATVYKVVHEELEVIRAVKMLKPGFTDETKERFKTEAKISANLHHPNIVQTYTVDSWNDAVPYIEMEFIDGFSLHDLLSDTQTLPWLFAAAIARIICQALDYAQTQEFTVYGKVYKGMVHRDIKPANILLSREGLVKLADFGIALPGNQSLHTQGPYTMGTYAYLSPEQLNGEQLDQRTDLYSLGIVMYEMVSGAKAYPQKSVAELVQRKMKGTYVPLKSRAPSLPKAFAAIVERCMAVEAGKRFQSSRELGEALEKIIAEVTDERAEAIISNFVTDSWRNAGEMELHQLKNPGTRRWAVVSIIAAVAIPIAILTALLIRYGRPLINVPDKPPAANAQSDKQDEPPPQTPTRKTPQPPQKPANKPSAAPKVDIPRHQPSARQHDGNRFQEGMQALKAGNYREAISLFEQTLDSESTGQNTDRARMRLLESYIADGQLETARAFIEKRTLDDAYFHLLAGNFYMRTRNIDQALIHYIKARTSSSQFGASVNREAAWQEALLRSDIYKRKPNLPNMQLALSSWTSFTETYCTSSKEPAMCRKAREYMARLSSR